MAEYLRDFAGMAGIEFLLIDENTRTASWVVESARDFVRIPNSSSVMAKIVNGQLGFDIHLVPIPGLAATQ